jgi:hypothetical protein
LLYFSISCIILFCRYEFSLAVFILLFFFTRRFWFMSPFSFRSCFPFIYIYIYHELMLHWLTVYVLSLEKKIKALLFLSFFLIR